MNDRIVVSFSEIDTYRDCPLKHQLAYVDRWQKEPEEGGPLARGSRWHEVMAVHYQTIREKAAWLADGTAGAKSTLALARTRIEEAGWFEGDEGELARWMYDGYVEQFGVDPQWEILAVEHKAELPLLTSKEVKRRASQIEFAERHSDQLSPDDPSIVDPVRFWVKVIIDLVIRDRMTGKLWIVDHKSAKDLNKKIDLELADQFGIYTAGCRALGRKVLGSMYNGARTYRLKTKAQPLDERFKREMMYRTDTELDNLIIDFRAAAEAAYSDRPIFSSPNPRDCSWKCEYRDAHLAARKGVPIEAALLDFGLKQQRERH